MKKRFLIISILFLLFWFTSYFLTLNYDKNHIEEKKQLNHLQENKLSNQVNKLWFKWYSNYAWKSWKKVQITIENFNIPIPQSILQEKIFKRKNIGSLCNFYSFPWKYDYILERWKKVKLNPSDMVSNMIKAFEEDHKEMPLIERKKYSEDFLLLLKWKVQWKFLLLDNLDKINLKDLRDFNWNFDLFFDVFWRYMFSIKDDKKFNEYSNYYLKVFESIKNKELIAVWHMYPLVLAYLNHYWNYLKCKEISEKMLNFYENDFDIWM